MRINKILLLCFLAIAVAKGITPVASADPIQFVHEGRGAGSIDGVSFAEAHFVITTWSDTDNRLQNRFAYYIDHDSALISIDGVGNFNFLTPTRTFLNSPVVGFSRTGSEGLDLFNGPNNGAFANWEMFTSIGPLSGTGRLLQWSSEDEDVETTGGVLAFDDNLTVVTTFTATVVPEPSSLLLIIGASLGLCGFSRWRQHGRR